MKNENKKTAKNYLYNLLYQLVAIITPLVTTPYLSRVLKSSGVGQVSFTNSVVSYFILFGALGFALYGQREIARNREEKERQSAVFWEIIICKTISVGISLLVYLVLLLLNVYGENYQPLMIILTMNVIATLFDITFFFQGNEKFGIIALKNSIIRIVGIVLIFTFVKNEKDVWIYVLCNSASLVLSNLSLWLNLKKIIVRVPLKSINFKRHIVPALKLFIPTLAISIYATLDKTLIGVLVPGTTEVLNDEGVLIVKKIADIENGYYHQAEQMVKMAITVISSLGAVMIPKNSEKVSSGDLLGFKKNIYNVSKFVLLIGVPIMFGLIGVSRNFSSWFYGDGYEKVPKLIMVLSPLVIAIGFGNVVGLQYLIPLKKDTHYTVSIVCGAIINLVLNIILIPRFYAFGAAISTVVAEFVVTGTMFFFSKKDLSIKTTFVVNGWKYWLSGLLMFEIVYLVQSKLSSSIIHTSILIIIGFVSYFVGLIVLREKFLFKIINSFSKRKRRI